VSTSTIETLERLLASDRDADNALRAAVEVLVSEPGIEWAGVVFVEGEDLVLGPSAGVADDDRRVRVPISFQDAKVDELWIDGTAEEELLRRATDLLSAHVLIGWDTQGGAWEP
jgi:hypothetical protein